MEYKLINLNDWIKKGEGGTASSYYHKTDDSLMLKLFTKKASKTGYALREYEFSKNVTGCGISTPKALEVVKTNDERNGVIYERIADKVSFSRLCVDNPNDIEKYAAIFADELKKIHKTKCNVQFFSSVKNIVTKCVEENKVFNKVTKTNLLDFIDELGECDTCLHGDPHSGNIIDSNGDLTWIDLGAFCYGSPWYDIGGVYFFYCDLVGIQFSKKLLHMKEKELQRFWKQFAYTYSGAKTEKEYIDFMTKAKKASLLFAIYTMDVENHKGLTAFVDSLLIIHHVKNWEGSND